MSTAYVSAKVVIDLVKEFSDVFPPLKSTASGLSAILKHCDVCIVCVLSSMMLTITPASDGKPTNNRISDPPD